MTECTLEECLLSQLSAHLLPRPLPTFGYLRLLLHELLCPQWVLIEHDEWSAMCGIVISNTTWKKDICYPLIAVVHPIIA